MMMMGKKECHRIIIIIYRRNSFPFPSATSNFYRFLAVSVVAASSFRPPTHPFNILYPLDVAKKRKINVRYLKRKVLSFVRDGGRRQIPFHSPNGFQLNI